VEHIFLSLIPRVFHFSVFFSLGFFEAQRLQLYPLVYLTVKKKANISRISIYTV